MFLDSAHSLHSKIFSKRAFFDYSPLRDDDNNNLETCDFSITIDVEFAEEAEELWNLQYIENCVKYNAKLLEDVDFIPENYQYYHEAENRKIITLDIEVDYEKWVNYLKVRHDNSCKGDFSLQKGKKVLLERIYRYYEETENEALEISEQIFGEYISDGNRIHENNSLEHRIRFCEAMDSLENDNFFETKKLTIDISAWTERITNVGFEQGTIQEIFKCLPAKHFTYKINLTPKFFEYSNSNNKKEEVYKLDLRNGYLFNERVGGKPLDIGSVEFKILKAFVNNKKNLVDLAPILDLNRKNKIDSTDLAIQSKELARNLRRILLVDKTVLVNRGGRLSLISVKIMDMSSSM